MALLIITGNNLRHPKTINTIRSTNGLEISLAQVAHLTWNSGWTTKAKLSKISAQIKACI